MNKNKKIYTFLLLLIVLIISLIAIGIILFKNRESKTQLKDEPIIENKLEKEVEEEKNQFSLDYTGIIRCVSESKENIEYFIDSNIQSLEVENGRVKTREIKRKIKFFNEESYNAFKNNENILNSIYDDNNFTVEYTTYEKEVINNFEINIYTKDLNKIGYECEEVINN